MKKTFFSISLAFSLFFAAYAGWWFWTADYIRTKIPGLIDRPLTVTVDSVSGFPGPFRVEGKATLGFPQVHYDVPAFTITGFFIPDFSVSLFLPRGAKASGSPDDDLWSVDSLTAEGIFLKESLPALTKEALIAWRDSGGRLTINHFTFKKPPLKGEGAGYVILDSTLQPESGINIRVQGHHDFLDILQKKGLVGKNDAALASALLSMMSKPDEQSENQVMDTGITLRDKLLSIGPMPIATLPEMHWPEEQ